MMLWRCLVLIVIVIRSLQVVHITFEDLCSRDLRELLHYIVLMFGLLCRRRSGIVQIVLIVEYHRVQEVVRVTHHVTLDLAIVLVAVLMMMIDSIHRLVMMLLCSTSLLYDNGLLALFNVVIQIKFVLDLLESRISCG